MGDIQVYDAITDLQLSKKDHNLKVKILKTWIRYVFDRPTEIYSLEFVCVDEQGNRAQGTLLASLFYRFQRYMQEQSIITIKKPILGSNGGSWTIVPAPLKVCFNRETEVAVSNEWSGSRHSFQFTDLKTVYDCEASRTNSIDIIGIMIDKSDLRKKVTNKVETTWVVIKLQDLNGQKIRVTLFDEYAYKITEFVEANPGVPHYCLIVQFARFKIYEGRHSVSTAFSASKLFINDSDIEEITTFLHRYGQTEYGQSSSSFKSGSNSTLISKEEDFLNVTDFKYTAQVEEMKDPKSVIVLGTIKLVNNRWFYMACNHCKKIVQSSLEPLQVTQGEAGSPREVVTYYCQTQDCVDNKRVIEAYPRYRVMLMVQDSTGTVDLTLFDSEAKKIINKPALEVFENYTPKDEEKDAPIVINVPDENAAFIDKRYAFKIDVTENHINKRYKSYTIGALTDDEKIITALDEKYFKHEVGTDNSQLISTQNISAKEVISICDDNVTPSSCNNSAKVMEHDKESNQLKRNLDDSYQDDELPAMYSAKKQSSSSKSDSTSKADDEAVVTEKLLIPKKEKC